jgi:hypothetical protein
VKFYAVAAARYADNFPQKDRTAQKSTRRTGEERFQEVHVLSSDRPPAPALVYVVPAFGWREPEPENGRVSRERFGGGLRIYLARPWFTSGCAERLACVVLPDGGTSYKPPDPRLPYEELEPRLQSQFCQWGMDPLWQTEKIVNPISISNFVNRSGSATGLVLDGTPIGCEPPSATLIHWYTFNGNVNDQVGNVHGILSAGANANAGLLSLNGTGAYVEFPSHIVPQSDSYSVALFAREAVGTPAVNQFVELISQGLSGGPGFYLGHTPNHVIRASDAWLTEVKFPTDGNEHHYALVVDASKNQAQLFIDGMLKATHPAFNTASGGSHTRLGRQFQPYGEFFRGSMSDVRIYSGALTPCEVAKLGGLPQASAALYDLTIEDNYDKERRLWFVDVQIDAGATYSPFVRLALARYQPMSKVGLELSRAVLADIHSLLSGRRAVVNRDKDKHRITVQVFGSAGSTPSKNGLSRQFEVFVERKAGKEFGGWISVSDAAVSEIQAPPGLLWSGAVNLKKEKFGHSHRVLIREYEVFGPGDANRRLVYADEIQI